MYVKFVTNTKPCILKLALINTTSKFIYYSLERIISKKLVTTYHIIIRKNGLHL